MKKAAGYFFLIILPLTVSVSFNTNDDENPSGDKIDFFVPEKTDKLLFYLQRRINANTVVYELNRNANGDIDIAEPVKISWIKNAKDTAREPLNYIQRTFAYGLEIKLIDAGKKSFSVEFVSYRKKQLFLLKSAFDNKYHIYAYINNKLSVLEKVFVQIEGGTFWFPNIKYVELKGNIPYASEEVVERIKP